MLLGWWPVVTLAVLAATLAGCTSSSTVAETTVPESTTSAAIASPVDSPSSQGCLDRSEIASLYKQWNKTSDDFAKMHTTNQEIALKLALATAGDPSISAHFKEAADAYAKAPPAPANVPIGSVSQSDMNKLFKAMGDGATAMSAGFKAVVGSSLPDC